MRSLSGRCRRKSQRLAEADDLGDEGFESESEDGEGSGDGSSARPSAETRLGADAAANAAPRMLQVRLACSACGPVPTLQQRTSYWSAERAIHRASLPAGAGCG